MHAVSFKNFRPISLCNFTYKVVSKIITTRMGKIINNIISPNQGAFVKGRWIADNSVIAQEIAHKVNTHKGKKGLMMIKIDMMKAYNKLEWSFIGKVLKAWGFSRDFQFLIFNCISSVEYEILVNGNKTKTVKPARGLRQGDPLSPFLFILSAEVLYRLLDKNENLQGIKINRRGYNSPFECKRSYDHLQGFKR